VDPEDFLEPEVGIAAAVVAAIAAPPVRKAIRRGAVFGLAGILMAGDAVASFARGIGEGAQRVAQQSATTAKHVPVMQHGNGSADGAGAAPAESEQQPAGEPS
jgi:hypothetical protein